jgi:hypothetical protein
LFWLDWDANCPTIVGLLVVVSSMPQWLVMAAKDMEMNWEAGDGSRGHCNVSGGVFFLFFHRKLSYVFQRKKTVNINDKRHRFWTGAAIFQSSPPSFNTS